MSIRLLVLAAFTISMPLDSQALVIPITAWTKAIADSKYIQWFNQAPSAYVWQNDPEIVAAYGRTAYRSTSFCEPSAIGTALYNQKIYRKTAPNLKVAGVNTGAKEIDTNQTLNDLVKRCKSDPATGTQSDNAFRCIADVYSESGYHNSEIKLITNDNLNYSVPYHFGKDDPMIPAIPFFKLEQRKPTLDDIVNALNSGYEVIAMATRIAIKDDKWKKVGGHWFNLSGYGKRPSATGLDLMVTDPTAYLQYGENGADPVLNGTKPLFYTITAIPMTTDADIVPPKYAPIRLRGLVIEKLTSDVVLGGLLLLKTQN